MGEGQSLGFQVPPETLLQVFFFFFFFPYYFLNPLNVDKEQNKETGQWALLQRLSKFSRREFNSRNLGALWANASFNITKSPHNEPEPELI